ncbi:MAG TPA: LptE family protein [Candidatus Binatia bacterium]|jgi:hypothetical protein|nr:LptE family protein [Candidatus Binatia bacterium]
MRVLAALTLVVAAGCGYHLAGRGAVPETARTIEIRSFENRTPATGIDVQLHNAVEDEFRRHGLLRVVEEGEGDVALTATVTGFEAYPVTASGLDEPLQYLVVIRARFALTERETGKTLYENRTLSEQVDFASVSGVVIPSSPHFQRGTMNVRDLIDLTNAQLGDTRRREATGDLVKSLARDIYSQTMEGF